MDFVQKCFNIFEQENLPTLEPPKRTDSHNMEYI